MNLINIYTTLEVADENSSLEKNEVYPNKIPKICIILSHKGYIIR